MSSVKFAKKSSRLKSAASGAKPKAGDFVFQDNEDGTYTVGGVDAAGAPVDISAVATLTADSSDASIFTADPPSGMTGVIHAVKPGSGTLTNVATWNDGSVGPFTVTTPITVASGPATGLTVTFGPPTVR